MSCKEERITIMERAEGSIGKSEIHDDEEKTPDAHKTREHNVQTGNARRKRRGDGRARREGERKGREFDAQRVESNLSFHRGGGVGARKHFKELGLRAQVKEPLK